MQSSNFIKSILLSTVLFFLPSSQISAATETLTTGAFIINMGIVPQTIANGLKPYGMIYDLVKNYSVPIKWVINPGKVKDGIDFSYGGTDFKGGPFIIESEFRTAAVNARITYWQSQGVVGTTTTAPITVPVYTTVRVMPQWTMDQQNGSIAVPFFTNAGIPATAYGGASSSGWKTPAQLTCCDDLFVMPHADPKWLTHGNLYNWNLNCKGAVWLGCHAGSALMDMFNPAIPTQQTNFLVEKTAVATGAGPWSENALKLWGNHSDGTLPYAYSHLDDPVMQFMGIIDAAQQNGSEQIYIPMAGGWLPTTKVGIYDPAHTEVISADPKHRAASLAYGRGFGDVNRGYVMLEGSHNIGGSGTANVGAQRVFFNYSLLTALQKAIIPEPIPAIAGNDTAYSGVGVGYVFNLPAGYNPADYKVQWSSTCAGTFTPNATQREVSFVPPNVTGATLCYVNIEITDVCGRKFNNNKKIVIVCALSVTATVTNPTCGGGLGSISFAPTGGTAPYTYKWARGATTGNGTGTTIAGLIAGSYNITVTSANGCAQSFTQILTDPTPLSINAVSTNVLCNGTPTGAIDATTTGGTSPYTYNWGGGITTEDRTALAAGIYNVTVTDVNACTATATATLTEPTAINITTTPTHINCNGATTGAISTVVSGGASPYTFNWGGGVTTQNRTALAAGTYSLTVTDANNCTKITATTVSKPTAGMALSTNITHISCGGGTGAINLTATGGTSPYTYNWGGGITTEDRSTLAAGTYTVTVTDNKGCTEIISATINQTNGPTLTKVVTNVLCVGGTGAIDLTATGIAPFSYNWADGVATEDRTGVAAGTYTVTVTDAQGCQANTSATITAPSVILAVSATSTNILCNGGTTGEINLTATGGTAPYTYDWGGGITTQNRTALAAGTYSVTVTDANGCTTTLSKTITQPSPLSISTVLTQISCTGATDGAIDLTVTNGATPYTYAWTGGVTTEDRTALGVGTYNVTVTDANGCTATTSAVLTALKSAPNQAVGLKH